MAEKRLKIPETVLDLVVSMTKIDPEERFTLDQVKKHPWYLKKPTIFEE